MTQDEKWAAKYNEVKCFIETNHQQGIFHIQYEPDTDRIDLYTTEMKKKNYEWPVFDIPFPLFVNSKGDGLDLIFKEVVSMKQYDRKDTHNARSFIQGLKNELVNPFQVIC